MKLLNNISYTVLAIAISSSTYASTTYAPNLDLSDYSSSDDYLSAFQGFEESEELPARPTAPSISDLHTSDFDLLDTQDFEEAEGHFNDARPMALPTLAVKKIKDSNAIATAISIPELVAEFFSHLSLEDQVKAGRTCKAFNDEACYAMRLALRPLLADPGIFSPEEIADAEKLSRTSPLAEKILNEKHLAPHRKTFEEHGYTFVIKGAPSPASLNGVPLSALLNNEFITRLGGRVASLYDLYKRDQKTLIEEFFPELKGRWKKPKNFHKAAIQHLLSKVRLYLSKDISDEQINTLKGGFLKSHLLKTIFDQHNYVSLKDLKDVEKSRALTGKAAHIAVTASEMRQVKNIRFLEALIVKNPDHTLLLMADTKILKKGRLRLNSAQIPSNLRHLALIDINKKVTSIGDSCLDNHRNLISLDLSSLSALTTIRDWFLFGTDTIISIDISNLKALKTIGDDFLTGTFNMRSIDMSDLIALTTIGGDFLGFTEKLTRVDMSGLTGINKIGPNFLWANNKRVKEIRVNGCEHLKGLIENATNPETKVRGRVKYLTL